MKPLAHLALATLATLTAALPAAAQSFISTRANYTWNIQMADPLRSAADGLTEEVEVAGQSARVTDACGALPVGGSCTITSLGQLQPPDTPERPGWTWVGGELQPGIFSPWQSRTLVAEAQTDWGVNRVRAFGAGIDCGPTFCSNDGSVLASFERATAESAYYEHFDYQGPGGAFQAFVRLDGRWAGGAGFSFTAGLRDRDGRIEGITVVNCLSAADCGRDLPANTVFLPGDDAANRNGRFDILVVVPLQLLEDTPFLFAAEMLATAEAGQAGNQVVDVFNTARVEGFRLAPGATLAAGSGTAYAVTAVPEPGAAWLALAGLAVLARRLRRRP